MIIYHLRLGFKVMLLMVLADFSFAQDRSDSLGKGADLPKKQPFLSGKQDEGYVRKQRMMSFREVDTNHDRKLVFDEFKQLKRLQHMEADKQRKLFDFLDQNHDGQLEINEVFIPKPRWGAADRKEFQRFDKNGDGCLDLIEFSSLLRGSKTHELDAAESFERLDQNNNGKIERFEWGSKFRRFNNAKPDFASHDVDGSGGLNYAEYSEIPWVTRLPDERREKLFIRIDADGNGEISITEIGMMYKDKRRLHGPPHLDRGKREPGFKGREFGQ